MRCPQRRRGNVENRRSRFVRWSHYHYRVRARGDTGAGTGAYPRRSTAVPVVRATPVYVLTAVRAAKRP